MKKLFAFFLFILFSFISFAETFSVNGIEFAYRLPQKQNASTRIMVLFGGRNWKGENTLKAFNFNEFADKYNLILLSPSFKDNDYWEPEKWSGKTLKSAVKQLEEKYKLKPQKLLFYGYSAGGQCANLFYNYMHNQVEAWGLHACGVYPDTPIKRGVPALITCGINDAERIQISKKFVYKYRENGGELIWKTYQTGHELNKEALEIAKAFFTAILEKQKAKFIGEDDTLRALPINKKSEIDLEFRNYLYSEELKKLWEAK